VVESDSPSIKVCPCSSTSQGADIQELERNHLIRPRLAKTLVSQEYQHLGSDAVVAIIRLAQQWLYSLARNSGTVMLQHAPRQ